MRLAVVLIGAAALSAPLAAAAAPGGHTVTVYTVASGVQFINTADDRARGARNNPFDADTQKLAPKVNETGNGPFAGDVAVYSFDLFANAKLGKRAGTASYTCYFNYNKHALCVAYYELSGGVGTLVASGPVDFNANGFQLVLTGGTKSYLAASGEVKAVPAARNAQRVDFVLGAKPAQAGRKLTVSAVASTVQFMNHADDRLRGMSINPFNATKQAQRVVITKVKEQGNGPFPGDDVLYTFKLYTSPSRARSAGNAIFTCYYDAVKHALCDSYFELGGGTILASGPVPFGSTRFTLSVTGGTGDFAGVGGEVKAVPAAKNTQRIDVALTQ